MLEVHRDVALSNPLKEHVHKQTTPSRVNPDPRMPCHKDWWGYQFVVSIFGDHLGLLLCPADQGLWL